LDFGLQAGYRLWYSSPHLKTARRSSRAAWVGVIVCAIILCVQQSAQAQNPDWDPGLPKDVFSTGNPPERLRAAKCKDCADKMAALQAALNDWYAMRLAEIDKILNDQNKPPQKTQERLEKEKAEMLKGLGNPKDGGADAKDKQKKNSDKDFEELKKKKEKGKKPKDILKEKIAKALKDLQDCEANCPPPGSETTPPAPPPPPPPPPEETTPTPAPQKPPALPDPITLPTPPPCFDTEAQREAFLSKWDPIAAKERNLARMATKEVLATDKQDPWFIYWQKKEAIHQTSADALQKIIDDAADPKKTPVPCPKKTTTGGGGAKTPTPKPGKPKKPRTTTGHNISFDDGGAGLSEDFCALISENKIRIDDTFGTGETIGHVADLVIENLTDQPIEVTIPPMVLESRSRKNQHYGSRGGDTVEVPPHSKKKVPLDGICLARNKPPVGKDVGGDLAINDCDPDAHISHDDAHRMMRIAESKYDAADKLEEDGKLKEMPYRDAKKRKDIVVQWSTWADPRISEITGAPPATKDDLKKTVYKQAEEHGPVTPDKKKKLDDGIDTLWDKIELTTEKAKDLEKPPTEEEATPGMPPGTGENISNETPTPGSETQKKHKKEKEKKKKKLKWPKPIQDWVDKKKAADDAYRERERKRYLYTFERKKFFDKSKRHGELEEKIAKIQGTLTSPLNKNNAAENDKLIQERDDLKKELAKLEGELEKDFQQTDEGKKALAAQGDAEKAADDARKAEQEAGKYIDQETKDDVQKKEDLFKAVPAVW